MNLYDVLGIPRDATKEDIKKAYRKRAAKCHPDVGGDVEEMKSIVHAYGVLSDHLKKDYYDNHGREERVEPFTVFFSELYQKYFKRIIKNVQDESCSDIRAGFLEVVQELLIEVDKALRTLDKEDKYTTKLENVRKRFILKNGHDILGALIDADIKNRKERIHREFIAKFQFH